MKIGIARLRSRTRYTKPLEHILDSWFYLLDRYIKDNPQHQFKYYNVTFDGTMPKRVPEELENCDHILIPTENEFHYQTKGYIHTLQKAKSDEYLRQLEDVLQTGQKITLLTSDKGDTIPLYRDRVFKKDFAYTQLDESDFKYGLHSLKYHFMKDLSIPPNKPYDFVYWGTSKRKDPNNKNTTDDRWTILNDIHNYNVKSFFIGRFDKFKPDLKFQMDFKKTLYYILQGRSTLCFNWLDSKTHTSRYHEALACGLIPFTWKQYDERNELRALPFQKCYGTSDIKYGLDEIKYDLTYKTKFNEIKARYEENLPSMDDQYETFNKLIVGVIT
jgi:hypothetical protein